MKNLNKYIEFNDMTWKYFVCWGVLGVFSMLFFMYNFDFPLAVWQADDMLTNLKSGHFENFYSYFIELANEGRYDIFCYPSREYYIAAYNILVYFVLALWILPIRFICWIFGINYSVFALSIWCKLLLMIADLIAIKELGEIFVLMGWNKKECNVGVACFMSSAVIMFGSLMFGQVEIFTLVIILYSLKLYLKKNRINSVWLAQ